MKGGANSPPAKAAERERGEAIGMETGDDAASALLQVGIVMKASAAIITGTVVLVWAGAALGGAGAVLSILTFFGAA